VKMVSEPESHEPGKGGSSVGSSLRNSYMSYHIRLETELEGEDTPRLALLGRSCRSEKVVYHAEPMYALFMVKYLISWTQAAYVCSLTLRTTWVRETPSSRW
jgi:hypothetical protein